LSNIHSLFISGYPPKQLKGAHSTLLKDLNIKTGESFTIEKIKEDDVPTQTAMPVAPEGAEAIIPPPATKVISIVSFKKNYILSQWNIEI